MGSDAAKKRKEQKAKAKAAKLGIKAAGPSASSGTANDDGAAEISDRVVTGVLASHRMARDVQIVNFSLTFHGRELVHDTELNLNHGRRYGLLGLNGCGKSTLLKALGHREVDIPDHIDIYYLEREIDATDMTALQAVTEADAERKKLNEYVEMLTQEEEPDVDALDDAYKRLDELESESAERRAGKILHGLGFTNDMLQKKTKEFSGGWRMRIALARALYLKPMMLLLDEPTNHLDLEACVWLEEYLKRFERILVLISHSQDFLNGVCTNIIHMKDKKLSYYSGNYDTYVRTRAELEENQMKRYEWEQDQIAHMKEYIARFGHGSAKLARQAQSKEKTLAKMEREGLAEKVTPDQIINFKFNCNGKLPPPVMMFQNVKFGYSEDKVLYDNLDFGVDLDSRIALVGPNGVGKSTLLKLMVDELIPLDGMVRRHHHLRIARYHQHIAEKVDLDLSPLEYMMQEYPGNTIEVMRSAIGRFGLTGTHQTSPIRTLSDGLKSRLVFAWISYRQPHLLLLDEPTNHLDIESIDSLASAINAWDGGMVLVSHDFRLIDQVAKEIWVCENKAVTPWKGDIREYKLHLQKQQILE